MYCWKCGKELPERAYFCVFCGAKMSIPEPSPLPDDAPRPADSRPKAEPAPEWASGPALEPAPELKPFAERRPEPAPAPAPVPEPEPEPEPEMGGLFVPAPLAGGSHTPATSGETNWKPVPSSETPRVMSYHEERVSPPETAGKPYSYKESVAPETLSLAGSASASGPAETGTPAGKSKKKSKGKDITYWIIAIAFVVFSIMNIRDMNAGEMYTVWFGIPIQYVMLPGAVLFIILGIVDMTKRE